MSKQTTLQRVQKDIENGNLGKARDRLLGLISTYPNDLSLRSHLGRIYWQLQHPGMAGLFWYLEEDPDEDVQRAITEFERVCGDDPKRILMRLKLKFPLDDIPDGYAKSRVLALRDQAFEWHSYFSPGERKALAMPDTERDNHVSRWLLAGCAIVSLSMLFLMIMGIIHIAGWF